MAGLAVSVFAAACTLTSEKSTMVSWTPVFSKYDLISAPERKTVVSDLDGWTAILAVASRIR